MKLFAWLRLRLFGPPPCQHGFRMSQLGKNPAPKADESDRILWPCAHCGTVFSAHCGLDITPRHGPIIPEAGQIKNQES